MRDNHNGMPELLETFEVDGNYFAVIELEKDSPPKKFQFGVSRSGYLALKRVLEFRPFDLMPGLKYRYFFTSSYRRLPNDNREVGVRVEHDRDSKQFDFEIPQDLFANLLWFNLLENFEDAEAILSKLEVS